MERSQWQKCPLPSRSNECLPPKVLNLALSLYIRAAKRRAAAVRVIITNRSRARTHKTRSDWQSRKPDGIIFSLINCVASPLHATWRHEQQQQQQQQ